MPVMLEMEEGNRQAPDCPLPPLPPAILNLSSDDPEHPGSQAPKPPALFTCFKVVFGFILELLLMMLWLQPGTKVTPRNVALACARGTIYTGASSIGYSLVLTLKAQGKPEQQTWVTSSVSEALGLSDNACSPLTIRSKRDTLDFLFQPTALPSSTPAPSSSSASPPLASAAVAAEEEKVMAIAATALPSSTSGPFSSSASPSPTSAAVAAEEAKVMATSATALPSSTSGPFSSSAAPSPTSAAVAAEEDKVVATSEPVTNEPALASSTSRPFSSSPPPSLTTAGPDSEETDGPGPEEPTSSTLQSGGEPHPGGVPQSSTMQTNSPAASSSDKAGSKLGYNTTESPSFSKQDWCLDADQYCAPERNQKGFTIPLNPVLVGASSVAIVVFLIFASFLAGIFFKRFDQSGSPSDPTLYAVRTTKEELNKRNQ